MLSISPVSVIFLTCEVPFSPWYLNVTYSICEREISAAAVSERTPDPKTDHIDTIDTTDTITKIDKSTNGAFLTFFCGIHFTSHLNFYIHCIPKKIKMQRLYQIVTKKRKIVIFL